MKKKKIFSDKLRANIGKGDVTYGDGRIKIE